MADIFDYSHTCPTIDDNIYETKKAIKQAFDYLIDELDIEKTQEVKDIIDNYAEWLYGEIEEYFENVRSTNEDMRKEANNQMEWLQEEINALKNDNDDLKFEVSKLQQELETCETALEN